MELKLEDYVHPSLEIEVPIEIRKQVYEKAIELVLEFDNFMLGNHNSLCLLLPCILWNLKSFMNVSPMRQDWRYEDTSIAFPELENKIKLITSNEDYDSSKCNEFRKQILQEMLNELNNK